MTPTGFTDQVVFGFDVASSEIASLTTAFAKLGDAANQLTVTFTSLQADPRLLRMLFGGRLPKRARKRCESARKQKRKAARAAYREAQRQSI